MSVLICMIWGEIEGMVLTLHSAGGLRGRES